MCRALYYHRASAHVDVVVDKMAQVQVPLSTSVSPAKKRYKIIWEVVGLERGPLSLVSTNEELLDRKVAAPV
jgi:hypothetical protein